MPRKSAGLLRYRMKNDTLEVFLVHPGGPFWTNRDQGAWSIPKGEFSENEDPVAAAKREFNEETGFSGEGEVLELGFLRQPSNKIVYAFAQEGDCAPDRISSNTFEMEWPPHSGKQQRFPEVDRAAWFSIETAREKLHQGQVGFLDRLLEKLGRRRRNGGRGDAETRGGKRLRAEVRIRMTEDGGQGTEGGCR